MMTLTPKMKKVLARAAKRDGGNVCPIVDVRAPGNSEMMLLHGLRRRGLIDGMDENGMGVPRINDAGRAAAECDFPD